MDIPQLQTIVVGLSSGTLTYPAARFLFYSFRANGFLAGLSGAAHRWIALAIAFLLATAGLAGGLYLYDMDVTAESVWQAGAAAFLASQMLHAEIEKRTG